MKTYFECIPCFTRQILEVVRKATDDERLQEEALRQSLAAMSTTDFQDSPPAAIARFHRIIREVTGNRDPFRDDKERLNRLTLDLVPHFSKIIHESDDPIATAIRLSSAGNVIDFVVSNTVDRSKIDQAVDRALASDLDPAMLQAFKKSTAEASRILYLGDNAGEIVFDRLLIELLPYDKVTFAVKGSPTVNDALRTDAEFVGLTDLVEVIDNGADVPGTDLKSCSESFRRRFDDADLVISKGMGNYESLSEVDKHVFFIFTAKCIVMKLHLGLNVGSLGFIDHNPAMK